ncbi:MAG: hypothetical protein O3A87_04805 [Verrucomicrobia bacterium]|nr:hypothetical protein [Verrucomicrobiota bacterium]MDA1005787.1 hypothetical protein [Verrucomicrobiota bacterium]
MTESFSVEVNFRYDWTESLSGTSFDVDLSGFSVGIGARYTFW